MITKINHTPRASNNDIVIRHDLEPEQIFMPWYLPPSLVCYRHGLRHQLIFWFAHHPSNLPTLFNWNQYAAWDFLKLNLAFHTLNRYENCNSSTQRYLLLGKETLLCCRGMNRRRTSKVILWSLSWSHLSRKSPMQCSRAYKNGTIYDVVIASETNSSTRVEHKIVDAVIGPSNYICCICFLLKTLLFLNRIPICCDVALAKKRSCVINEKRHQECNVGFGTIIIILFLPIKRVYLPGLKISPCTLV